MKNIEQHLSPLIENQFPSFYAEEGPIFIQFLKCYYEWLEQPNNAIYHARKLLEYHDIDETVEDFIIYFKEQTLKNIQFDVATNKRLLVKNALDVYRSKGTARSIDLFFKLVYAQPASVYYPGDDIFKLSDNTWKIPTYLEVTESNTNYEFEGKQITGLASGATAFVENYAIKKKINDQYDAQGNLVKISKKIHIFYISNIRGNFLYNEKITYSGLADPRNTPKVIGSLTNLQVITGASNYQIGDVVTLTSNTGVNGKALVTSIINTTGEVEFTLIDGGWGYTTNPKIIISEKSLQIDNIVVSNSSITKPFVLFEELIQPKANINYENLTGGTLSVGDNILTYQSTTESGKGKIISINVSNSTHGNIYVSVLSGNLQSNARFHKEGTGSPGTIYANTITGGFENKTSFANIMGVSSNNLFLLQDITSENIFQIGEEIYQNDGSVKIASASVQNVERRGSNLIVGVVNSNGAFKSNQRVFGVSSSANANLYSYSSFIGIYDLSDTSVYSVNVVNGGENYSNSDIVTFASNTGFGAFAKVVTNISGNITSIQVLNRGSGYVEVPQATIVNTASPVYFNANTSVNETTDFITLSNNQFVNAQAIKYSYTPSNTALSGLLDNTIYYARFSNSSGLKLSETPSGSVISLTKGLTENGHSFTAVVSGGTGASLSVVMGKPFDFDNNLFVYGNTSNTQAYISLVGEGSLAQLSISSLDDEETVELNNDFISGYNVHGARYLDIKIDGSSNSALSGSNAYGFPAFPSGNIEFGYIRDMLTIDSYNIGTITNFSRTNPGDDYTIDPFITIIEPVIAGHSKNDFIFTIEGSAFNFADDENVLVVSKRSFTPSTIVDSFISIENNTFTNGDVVKYTTAAGNTIVGGLANNQSYYVVQADNTGLKLSSVSGGPAIALVAGSFELGQYLENGVASKVGVITEKIDEKTLRVKRLTFSDYIFKEGQIFLRGESSGYTTQLTSLAEDDTISGLNSIAEANVITANGAVTSLKVIDSGYGYEQADVVSFSKEGDPESTVGLAKVILELQGKGSGFFQNTKGFLSQDKYLHDNDYYQDYSYEIISRVPFERYSQMLKKVLHVAGTKMFPGVNITSVNDVEIKSYRNGHVKTYFNPYSSVLINPDNFIILSNHEFANGDIVTYSVESGNTVIEGKTKSFNPSTDVVTERMYFYANSDVIENSRFINFSQHNFVEFQPIRYIVSGGNTALKYFSSTSNNQLLQLINNATYYVKDSNSSGISISKYPGGQEVLIVKGFQENGHSFSAYEDFITLSSHTFANGDLITYTVNSGNLDIIGLSNNSTYYVSYANSLGIKLALNANGSNIVKYNIANNYRISTIQIVNGGSGYDSTINNKITISGGGGTGASAIFGNNASGVITSITMLNNGKGYVSVPDVSPNSQSNGTGAVLTAVLANTFPNENGHNIKHRLVNNHSYYVSYANTTGIKLSTTANGSSIMYLQEPLPNQIGHGIQKTF